MLTVLQSSKEAYASQVEHLRQEHLSNQRARNDMELKLRRLIADRESMSISIEDLTSRISKQQMMGPSPNLALNCSDLSVSAKTRTCGDLLAPKLDL